RKIGVLAFDVHDSDMALQTAFPLLVRNLVTSLLPLPAGGLPASVAPGETVGIDAPGKAVKQVLVEDPSVKEWTYQVPSGTPRVVFGETTQPGVYYVSYYGAAGGAKQATPAAQQGAGGAQQGGSGAPLAAPLL